MWIILWEHSEKNGWISLIKNKIEQEQQIVRRVLFHGAGDLNKAQDKHFRVDIEKQGVQHRKHEQGEVKKVPQPQQGTTERELQGVEHPLHDELLYGEYS